MQTKLISASRASPSCFPGVRMCSSLFYSSLHLLVCFCAATSASVWSWTRMTRSVSATTSRWKSSASSWIRQRSWFTWTGRYFCRTGALFFPKSWSSSHDYLICIYKTRALKYGSFSSRTCHVSWNSADACAASKTESVLEVWVEACTVPLLHI